VPNVYVPHETIMGVDEFVRGLEAIDATAGEIALFVGSDRTTGYRWKRVGPSNGVARIIQILVALKLSLFEAEDLIAGTRKATVVFDE
jgi:hypothetical protein